MSDKFITLADIPDLKLNNLADEYTNNWFRTHGVLAASELAKLAPGSGDKPLVYFRTHEVNLDSPKNAGVQTPFQSDLGPLRIRGTLTGTDVDAQVGLSPTPAVFYALVDLKGDLSNGPITKEIEDALYKGKFTLSLPQNELGGGLFGNIDWLGLGTKVVNTALSLLG